MAYNVANRNELRSAMWTDIKFEYSDHQGSSWDDMYDYLNAKLNDGITGFYCASESDFNTSESYESQARTDAGVLINYAMTQYENNITTLNSSYPANLFGGSSSGNTDNTDNTGGANGPNGSSGNNSGNYRTQIESAINNLINDADFTKPSSYNEFKNNCIQVCRYITVDSDDTSIYNSILEEVAQSKWSSLNSSSSNSEPGTTTTAKYTTFEKFKTDLNAVVDEWFETVNNKTNYTQKQFADELENKIKNSSNNFATYASQITDLAEQAKALKYIERPSAFN